MPGNNGGQTPENYEIQSEKKAIAKAFTIILLPLAWTDGCCWTANRCQLSMNYRMNRTYYDVCFEKGLCRRAGAYTMINRDFAPYRQASGIEFFEP